MLFNYPIQSDWDPCLDPKDNLCDEEAICTRDSDSPGSYSCDCIAGYHGDGYNCQPIDPCQTNYGDCDITTTQCVYHGPGEVSVFKLFFNDLASVVMFIILMTLSSSCLSYYIYLYLSSHPTRPLHFIVITSVTDCNEP